jgi:hypothetical protein
MIIKYKYQCPVRDALRRDERNRYPLIETERLILRSFRNEDAGAVQRLAGDNAGQYQIANLW